MGEIAGIRVAAYCNTFGMRIGVCILNKTENLWHEGFAAGEKYLHKCPYPPGSIESNIWRAGWVQGILKSHGCDYRDEPLGFEENESLKDLIRW